MGCWILMLSLAVAAAGVGPDRVSPTIPSPLPEGLRLLLEKPYLPPDFDGELFDQLWRIWEQPLRDRASKMPTNQRRLLAFERYGLDPVPDRDLPAQFTKTADGGWAMNCFACHGGKVAGKLMLGAPNSLFAMQTLYDDVRMAKIFLGKRFSHMDVGSMVVPLGGTIGTTNAIVFGIALGANRDEDLNFRRRFFSYKLLHHDHDAPAWWNLHRKTHMYLDGFAPKDHRGLMQFFLVEANGPKQYHDWENDYRKILAWMETLRPPKYPWPVDEPLATQGRIAFERNCATCHGKYGPDDRYPEVPVAIDELGTDRARFDAIDPKMREGYKKSWFGRNVANKVIVRSEGYVAPALGGVWASAPYLHNGSVPTLWHMLHPKERPAIWRRSRDIYDTKKVGLEFSKVAKVPEKISAVERRWYFDTANFGKSAAGHNYPDRLSENEKSAVLEYLKTL